MSVLAVSRRTGPGATLGVVAAFVRRDRRVEASYRIGLVLRLAASIVTVAVFFFIGRAVGGDAGALGAVPGGYFAFVLVGIAMNEYLASSLGGIGSAIRESQVTGTLEHQLLSPSRPTTILVATAIWPQLAATLTVTVYLVVGSALGLDLSGAHVPGLLLTVALAILAFCGLGLLAGSVVLLVKRGNPLGWAIRGASVVLGGVFYPVSVLPDALRALSAALPTTHAVEAARVLVLGSGSLADAAPSLAALGVLAVIGGGLGLGACLLALRWARADGSLGQY